MRLIFAFPCTVTKLQHTPPQKHHRHSVCRHAIGSILKQRLCKFLRHKRAQIFHFFAHANPFHRHGKLRLDADDDTALCRPIQLREHHAGNRGRLREKLCLADSILARRGIQHQQGLMRRTRYLAGNHPMDLLELFHEVCLGLQTSCSIDDQNVDVAGPCGFDSVKSHCRRVGALLVPNKGSAGALAPHGQLVDSRCPESVRRSKHDLLSLLPVISAELSDIIIKIKFQFLLIKFFQI